MPKIHMVRSTFPLVANAEQTAECGKVIKAAQFPFVLDSDFEEAAKFNQLMVCSRCSARIKNVAKTQYLYGLLNGQEAILGSEA